MKTQITVKRPDGTTEIIEKPGTVLDAAMRRKFEAATKAAGRGDIIRWEIVGKPPTGPSDRQILYGGTRTDRRCRGCGQVDDDGECGLGNVSR